MRMPSPHDMRVKDARLPWLAITNPPFTPRSGVLAGDDDDPVRSGSMAIPKIVRLANHAPDYHTTPQALAAILRRGRSAEGLAVSDPERESSQSDVLGSVHTNGGGHPGPCLCLA